MNPSEIKELLQRSPFQPFRVLTSSGVAYEIRNPEMAAILQNRMFIALHGDDRYTTVPFLHITSIETVQLA